MLTTVAPLVLSLVGAQEAPSQDPAVRLVVLISVDQLMPEQLDRLGTHLDGGLGRLVREGATFRDAALPYAATETGPGHATFATGCLPRSHGLVGNSYYDRELGRRVYCVEDPDALAVTSAGVQEAGGNGRSPKNLRRPSLGGHLQQGTPRTKVVSISAKDRAAITMGGSSADVALWWDRGGLGFVSSNYLGEALPGWALEWNAGWIERTAGWTWKTTFAADEVPPGTAPDVRKGEGRIGLLGPAFPYVFGRTPTDDYDAGDRKALASLAYISPLVDRFVVELARAAVQTEDLGTDEIVDLLCVSFSACDTVGHTFGPFSVEVTDLLLRLDDELGGLFEDLDARVGEGRWLAALTADHGVLPLVETLVEQGKPAVRVTSDMRRELQRHVETKVAEAFELESDRTLRFPTRSNGFFFDSEAIGAAGLDAAEVRRVVADAAVDLPWIHRAFSYEELVSETPTEEEYLVLGRNSHATDRGMDVLIIAEPYHLVAGPMGTSHGSAHAYDRRVPLVFYGPGVPAGVQVGEAGPQDAVPTLLQLLGRDPSGPLDGRSLLGSGQ